VEDTVFTVAVLPAALAVIMGSLGLMLTPADFRRVLVFPRGVGIGLLNLLLISPLLAFAVANVFSLEAGLAVGLVILGASPGGAMANVLTHLARGDTALSVTMTATSSVLAVVTVPLFMGLAISHFDAAAFDESLNMLSVVARVLAITIVPISIGMYVRSRRTERVIGLEPQIKRLVLVVFVGIVIGAIASEHDRVLDNLEEVALATIALNLAAMAISFGIARVAGLDDRQSTAIALELGIHNSALAIAVAATVSTVLTIPAAVYSSFMFLSAGAFAKLMHTRNGRLAEDGRTPVTQVSGG
jgi:BASS family bile acid:Na+ symporter